MCGRFNLIHTPGLDALLGALGHDLRLPTPRVNVAPTESVPLLRNDEVVEARWWLTPHWAKQPDQKYAMFNARSETLGRSPAFRGPFRRSRGMVPMSSFIEWRPESGGKQPWLISNEAQALAIAALWDVWEGDEGTAPLLSCTLVTTAAAQAFSPWHARMPVMLSAEDLPRWLDNDRAIESGDPLFAPRLKEPLQLFPVDRAVGNSRSKSAALMEPAGETVFLQP
jgi:putative SOS response-associated peptidase YedK